MKSDRNSTEQAKILIVDDQPDNLRLLYQILKGKNLEALQTINSTAQRLDSLLNDLLMVTKMHADCLVLHKTEIDLYQLITNIVKRLRVAAQAKQINLVDNLAPSSKKIAVALNLFQRAIKDLLSNALKFSPPKTEIIIQVT